MTRPDFAAFHDAITGSVQYVVSDPATRCCAIIDPVLDYDEKSGAIATRNTDRLLARVRENGLELQWILDTHPHADHFSAADYLQRLTGVKTAIGTRIVEVQKLWAGLYSQPGQKTDGSQWDRLFEDGDTFELDSIPARVILSPGHTLASIAYVIGDAAFVHDTPFMPDSGTARADFPGGDAERLWQSIQTILGLPETTRLFTGHDYRPDGREALWESTVAAQKRDNINLKAHPSREEFVAFRRRRDARLADAAAHPPRPADQYQRRTDAGARGQRQAISQGLARSVSRRRLELIARADTRLRPLHGCYMTVFDPTCGCCVASR